MSSGRSRTIGAETGASRDLHWSAPRPERSRERTVITTTMMASTSMAGTCSKMMLATTIADSMIHLPIRAVKSIEASFAFQAERVLVYSLGAFARRSRFGSAPCVLVGHSMLDFTELGKNSLLAADSWMMADQTNTAETCSDAWTGWKRAARTESVERSDSRSLRSKLVLVPASKRVLVLATPSWSPERYRCGIMATQRR